MPVENRTQSTTALLARSVYVTLRHNSLRDLLAELLEEICKDVVIELFLLFLSIYNLFIELPLLPLTGEKLPSASI